MGPDEFDARAAAGSIVLSDVLEAYRLERCLPFIGEGIESYVDCEKRARTHAKFEEVKMLLRAIDGTKDEERKARLIARLERAQRGE